MAAISEPSQGTQGRISRTDHGGAAMDALASEAGLRWQRELFPKRPSSDAPQRSGPFVLDTATLPGVTERTSGGHYLHASTSDRRDASRRRMWWWRTEHQSVDHARWHTSRRKHGGMFAKLLGSGQELRAVAGACPPRAGSSVLSISRPIRATYARRRAVTDPQRWRSRHTCTAGDSCNPQRRTRVARIPIPTIRRRSRKPSSNRAYGRGAIANGHAGRNGRVRSRACNGERPGLSAGLTGSG